MFITQKIITIILTTLANTLKIILLLFVLATAKIMLRTNPESAIIILIVAAIFTALWYFSPYIKRFYNDLK